MARNLTAGPPLPVNEIQGDILIGLPKRHEHLMFFEIVDPVKFKAFLKTVDITSVQECLEKRQAIADNKAKGVQTLIPTPGSISHSRSEVSEDLVSEDSTRRLLHL